ncbi:hypothetical protein L9F63_014063, partial [Diploptera punctata]
QHGGVFSGGVYDYVIQSSSCLGGLARSPNEIKIAYQEMTILRPPEGLFSGVFLPSHGSSPAAVVLSETVGIALMASPLR